MPRQCSIVIKNHVQLIGYRGFIETIAIKNFLDDLKKISPEVSIGVEDKIAFPKPFGRVIVNLDREIFERLDEGVKILGEMRDTQYESVSILKDIKKLLERKA